MFEKNGEVFSEEYMGIEALHVTPSLQSSKIG
jgi:hypothetical protein